VKTDKAGGSGTIIYSEPNEDTPSKYSTYVITCHHVIEDALSVKKEWDSAVGRDVKREYRKVVVVEFFDYENVLPGHRPVNYSVDADIVAYDKDHDMALLKLRTKKQAQYVAKLCSSEKAKQLTIGDEVFAVGCAMLHDPILTKGIITHQGDEIDYKDYWMSNAQIIFGNSGGAVFTKDELEFLGIPSRMDVAGWGSPITHLGYFSPIHRIYEFFNEQLFHFLHDKTHTEKQCEKEREKRQKAEEERLKALLPEEEEETKKR